MFRTRFQTEEQKEKFSNAILDIIANLGGEEGISISYLLGEIRGSWKNVATNLSEFESILEDLGFTVTYVYKKNKPHIIRQTNVTV